MSELELQSNLGANVRRLREARGLSQQRMADLSGIPRPTWTSLESGSANPTLAVLAKAAVALQVSIEELVGTPRTDVHLYRSHEIATVKKGGVRVRPLVPDALPGMELSRMELRPRATMKGVPHTPGTREYLTCERGRIRLNAAGQSWLLHTGDMLVFRGDQHHSYQNPDATDGAVALSVVCFAGE